MNLEPRQYFGGYRYVEFPKSFVMDGSADIGYSCYGNNCNSTWNSWGRWVLLGCLIFAAFLIFFLLS